MAIKGSLKEASLPDVLQLLAMGGKTGCLSVTDRTSFGYIYFSSGRIVYASLLNRRDRLGDIFVRDDVITREQLEKAIEAQAERRDGRRLGEILVALGFLNDDTLQKYVKYQIEEAVYHLFTWRQGSFYFEPGQLPEGELIQVSIDAESILLEGARRVDEWGQIENKIPSMDLIFAVDSSKAASLSELELSSEQEQILPLLDGKHTVREIIEETALVEFDVGKAVYGLLTAGLARRVGQREPDRRREPRARVSEHRNLGVAFYKTAMFEEAEREFRRVLELDKTAADSTFYLGLVAFRTGDLAGADERFREALERGDPRAAVYNNLAIVLQALGKSAEALDVLKEGIEKTPGHPKLHLARAEVEFELDEPAAALASLDQYKEVAGQAKSARYYSVRALATAYEGDLDEAERIAAEGVEQHGASAPLANNAGLIFERKNDFDGAIAHYERAYEEESTLPQASKNIGDILYREGAYEEAAKAYERVLALDSESGDDVYAKLGNVYYKQRARDRAIEMWNRALELNPANEVVRTNLELVRDAAGDG